MICKICDLLADKHIIKVSHIMTIQHILAVDGYTEMYVSWVPKH